MSEWQPISSAPKDGTDVLIGWFEPEGRRSMAVAFWHGSHRCWANTHTLFTKDKSWQPSHWMSLPAPPTEST